LRLNLFLFNFSAHEIKVAFFCCALKIFVYYTPQLRATRDTNHVLALD